MSGLDSTVSAQSVIDYDSDDDGLIGVTTEAQLNAIRWDLDGSGVVDDAANATTYAAAFPTAAPQMGCPSAACTGYELAANITLTSNTGMGQAGRAASARCKRSCTRGPTRSTNGRVGSRSCSAAATQWPLER